MSEVYPSRKSCSKKKKTSAPATADSLVSPMFDSKPYSKPILSTKTSKKKKSPPLSSRVKELGKGMTEDPLAYCVCVLEELLGPTHHEYASPFYKPVDVAGLKLENYHDVVKHPMDLSTIKQKLDSRQYLNASEFASDVRLMVSNCYRFHLPADPVVEKAKKLQVSLKEFQE